MFPFKVYSLVQYVRITLLQVDFSNRLMDFKIIAKFKYIAKIINQLKKNYSCIGACYINISFGIKIYKYWKLNIFLGFIIKQVRMIQRITILPINLICRQVKDVKLEENYVTYL